MRKMKKTLALLAVLAMVLTMIPGKCLPLIQKHTLAGADRIWDCDSYCRCFWDADTVILRGR